MLAPTLWTAMRALRQFQQAVLAPMVRFQPFFARGLVAVAVLASACSDPAGDSETPLSDSGSGGAGGFGGGFDSLGIQFDGNLGTDGAAGGTSDGNIDGGLIFLADGGVTILDGTPVEVIAAATCSFPVNPKPGDPGATCKIAGDCDSGLCVEGPDGKQCTMKCTDCCPGGWLCTQFGDVDPVFACVPKSLRLCQPCTADKDCVTTGDPGLCLDYGSAGRFCGSACGTNGDCPPSYECKASQGVQGASKQCVRTVGMCTCSAKAVAEGMSTICSNANKFGTCTGTRKCTDAGLTDCTATVPAEEICNSKDDDCDSQTDEFGAAGCTLLWFDGDGDGFGAMAGNGGKSQCACNASGQFTAANATDCDDNDKAIKPTATEICNDIDDNCDAKTDFGCDNDKDGYCDAAQIVVGKPKVCTKGGKDCDDNKVEVNPSASEVCSNGADDNCNGSTDGEEGSVGCMPFFYDADKDGWGTGEPKCLCGATGAYTATKFGDCADSDPNVSPSIAEVCSNGKDDNCSGAQDEIDAQKCENFWSDKDSDGYGTGNPKCLCAPTAQLTVKKAGDCDDLDPQANPAAIESCNGIDDNCNGKADEVGAIGCILLYADADNDSFGDVSESACKCKPDAVHSVAVGGDCNDSKPQINPKGKEVCDSLDNNCNGVIDEANAGGCTTYFADLDGDGAGDGGQKACICAKAAPYTALKGDDCNDKKDAINPKAIEKCNGEDDNCDGAIDEEGAQLCNDYLYDEDGDGFGLSGKAKCLCKPGKPYGALKGGDCNDTSPVIFPGALELCNGIDDNCNNVIDDLSAQGCVNFYVDNDKDGYGDSKQIPKCLCKSETVYTTPQGGDCNDLDAKTYPTAKELCDGVDTNCNGIIDDSGASGCKAFFLDADSDGFGMASQSQCLCNATGQYSTTQAGDCNDGAAAIKPTAIETCNGIDDNCNGTTDSDSPQAKTYYADVDNDTFGAGGGKTLCQPDATFDATQAGDCNDGDPNINPSKPELCNGKDDNCDNGVDNGNAAAMCGSAFNANTVCSNGKCGLSCAIKWFDVDGQPANGCECPADPDYGLKGVNCSGAESVGTLSDSGAQSQQSGNIMPGESGDWFTFTASDSADGVGGCDQFNVRVKFVDNPDGKFVFDVFRGGCGASEQLCAATNDHTWSTNFYGAPPSGPGVLPNNPAGTYQKSPAPEKGGECKCTTTPGTPGMNVCKDNTAQFFVRVYRAPGAAASCANYKILFANGP
ncbi:MAG: hypothetical protein EXR77_00210 [Myxococcales bacterium]|nr:hypothetical protein [Myxococcales bacterium]